MIARGMYFVNQNENKKLTKDTGIRKRLFFRGRVYLLSAFFLYNKGIRNSSAPGVSTPDAKRTRKYIFDGYSREP